MTIFYNLEALKASSVKRCVPLLKVLGLIIGRIKPYNKAEVYCIEDYKKALHKTSFLRHPERLLADTKTAEDYKLQYLVLASYRDYSLFKLFGSLELPLSFFPELDIDKLKNNPILDTTDNNIKFKYEA